MAMTATHAVHTPEPAAGRDTTLDALRVEHRNANLLKGFGPLAVAAILFALMVMLLPSVAPERIVERAVPDKGATVTTVSPQGTTAPATVPVSVP